MTTGDQKKKIQWSRDMELAAAKIGLAIDHDGYVAVLDLLPPSVRKSLSV